MLKLDKSLTQAVSVEAYEIKISRFNFQPMFVYFYRVYFLTTLDIYKTYFKGNHTWRTYAESDLIHYSL